MFIINPPKIKVGAELCCDLRLKGIICCQHTHEWTGIPVIPHKQ